MTVKSLQSIIVGSGLFLLGAAGVWAQGEMKDLYLDKCATCHGADGAGKTAKGKKLKVKDVHQTASKMTAEEMLQILDKGKAPDMDAFGKQFNKQQMQGLIEYYRSLAK
jgi:mono/diheme cytochrome c family protein